MPQSRWAAMRFKLRAFINGIEFEVVQVVASFEMNAIPTCSITVAVGRNIRPPMQAAAAHTHLGKLKNRNEVLVYLNVEPLGSQGGAPNSWPKGPILIFAGHVTGTGWQRSTNGANFTIHAEHWLAELNYTSSINGASHPGNPAAFTYPAGFEMMQLGGGGGTDVGWLYHVQLDNGVTADMAKADLWENVLKPWALQVSKMPPEDARLAGGLEMPSGNDGAREILEGKGDYKIVSDSMSMQLDGPDSYALGNNLARALEKSMGNNVLNTTLWGKIVGEWSPAFWFSVVPRVEDALIVPFVGSLGPNQEFVRIKSGDYVQCDLQASVPQQLAAIGIQHPVEWLCGGNTNFATFKEESGGLAAVYPTPPKKKGVILMKECPYWMADPVQGYLFGRSAEGVQPRAPIGGPNDALNIGQGKDPPVDPDKNKKEFRDVIMRYAQHWYILEQLSGRTGEISGRLRFDVAPGSQVLVEAGQDKHLAGADALAMPFFASVAKVTYLINAEIQRAGTSFTLAHIRNAAENEDPDTSIDVPPMYVKAWNGKVLIDGFTPGA